MNPLDILIVIIFVYSMLLGFFRGFIREITAIAGVIGGFYCAYTWYPEGARFLSRWLSDPGYLRILGFLLIFSVIYSLAWLIGILIRRLAMDAFGKWPDRISGVLFSIVKSTLIVSILLAVLVAFLPKNAPVLKNSALAPGVTLLSEKMVSIIPNEMKKEFAEKLTHLRENWENPGTQTEK
ncbi:MAG: CvpA family protein [Desulfococcaceae bacterium]